jgi:hypothetical protein
MAHVSPVFVIGQKARYEILKPVAYTATYRLYVCRNESGEYCLLQIATEIEHNGGLERAAFILRRLMASSRHYDESYARDNNGHRLHYDRLFPEVVETFVSEQQGRRRVNILSFTDTPDVTRLIPLSNLKLKDRLRVDPKTDAWILGRLLKLMTLVHAEGVLIRKLGGSNVLLEPDLHFAIVLDWSSARMHQSAVPLEDSTRDIARATQAAYDALGDIDNGTYIYDDADAHYIDLLRHLKDGKAGLLTADQAHTMFYKLVRDIWPNEFHPFTTLPL